MSENNNENSQEIITEAEVLPAEQYDLDFITLSLGLIPILNGEAAINPASVTDMERDDEGKWLITLVNEQAYALDDSEMAEFEQALKDGIEKNRAKARENFKWQTIMQTEVVMELQSGVQQAGLVGIGADPRKRGRFH